MKKTTNYQLNKPELAEQYDIDNFNDNADKIDETMHNTSDKLDNEIRDRKNAVIDSAHGGSGKKTLQDSANAYLGSLPNGDTDKFDNGNFITSNANGTNTYFKRSAKFVWNWIKSKISSVLGLTKDNYGGKASKSGIADSVIEGAKMGDKTLATTNLVIDSAHGGSGKKTLKDSANAYIGSLGVGSTNISDDSVFITSDFNGDYFAYYKRKAPNVWGWIKSKISSVLGLTKDNYGGKANYANKLVGNGDEWGVAFKGTGDGINNAQFLTCFNEKTSQLYPFPTSTLFRRDHMSFDSGSGELTINLD